MRKGSTRRARIHLAVLLRDVAKMYAELTGSDAQVELKKINGYREERRKDEQAKNPDERPAVEILARIVMAMWGDEVGESLQRPARAALKLF
jgi:Na+/citrate or Na+/malate symporter